MLEGFNGIRVAGLLGWTTHPELIAMHQLSQVDSHDAAVMVDGLTFSYGTAQVLHGVSFAVSKGEVVGLLGPNDAGKSTTSKVLTGILSPGGGSVPVAGCSMPTEAVEGKKRIGYVPESVALFECLTAQEDVSSSTWNRGRL